MLQDMWDYLGQKCGDDIVMQLRFLFHGQHVKRFHTVPMLHGITVGHHQFGVAWLCYLLSNGKCPVNLIMAALSHDMAEQLWSDMPTPAKEYFNIREVMTECEQKTLSDYNAFFQLGLGDKTVLKTADLMQGMLECVYERRLGNRFVEAPYGRYRGLLHEVSMMRGPAYFDSFTARRAAVDNAIEVLWKESLTQTAPSDVHFGQPARPPVRTT